MPAQEYNEIGRGCRQKKSAAPRPGCPALLAAGAAAVGRLPAFGAWWNQDDWGLLARAAGVIPAAEVPVRWLSRIAYWSAMSPLAGLDPHPYTATRLVLFGLAAAGAGPPGRPPRPAAAPATGRRTAPGRARRSPSRRCTGRPASRTCWRSPPAIWACERWLAGGPARAAGRRRPGPGSPSRARRPSSGLPLLWAAWHLVRPPAGGRRRGRPSRPWSWSSCCWAPRAARLAGLRGFAGGDTDPYARGGPLAALANLGLYGWYLLSPGPIYAANVAPWMGAGRLDAVAGRDGVERRWPGAAAGALPAFATAGAVAGDRAGPAAGAPPRPVPRPRVGRLRRPRRRRSGAPAAGASRSAVIGRAGGGGRRLGRAGACACASTGVTPTVCPPIRWSGARRSPTRRPCTCGPRARRCRPAPAWSCCNRPPPRRRPRWPTDLGENWVTGSLLHRSLEGPLGPAPAPRAPTCRWPGPTAWPARRRPRWSWSMPARSSPSWGPTPQALLYLTLTDVGPRPLRPRAPPPGARRRAERPDRRLLLRPRRDGGRASTACARTTMRSWPSSRPAAREGHPRWEIEADQAALPRSVRGGARRHQATRRPSTKHDCLTATFDAVPGPRLLPRQRTAPQVRIATTSRSAPPPVC